MLSGFVLVLAHLKDFAPPVVKGWAYWWKFMRKRLARIYPAYLAGLLACMVLSVRLDNLSWAQVGLNATFLQPYAPWTWGIWYGGGSWSVSAEMFFYCFLPLLLPVLLRWGTRPLWLLFLACVLAGPAFALAGLNGSATYNLPPFRFPEFVAGMVAGVLIVQRAWRVPAWLPVALAIVAALWLSYTRLWLDNALLHDWLIIPTVVVVIAAMVQAMPLFKWLGAPVAKYLGEISYCFYIVQLPLLLALDALLASGRVSQADWGIAPIFLLVNFGGAVALHHLVEKPAHAWLTKHFFPKQRQKMRV